MMDYRDNNFLFQLLETMTDGVVLFQDNIAFFANSAAKQLLESDPIEKSLFYLLGNTDAELLEKDDNNNTVFYLLIHRNWVSATLSEHEGHVSMLTLREDTDVYTDPIPCPMDENDLSWLRMIASKISILSDACGGKLSPDMGEELHKYAAMLHKYINNSFLRAMPQPEFDTLDDLAYFTFASLLEYAVDQVKDSLSAVRIELDYSRKNEIHDAHVRGYVRHFLMLVYNALDILIYHCKEACGFAEPSQITVSEGASQSYLFLRISTSKLRPFPATLDVLSAYQREKPELFTPAYCASAKLVIATVKLYKGIIVSNASGDKTDILFCFPKDYARLASPYDFSGCTVYPKIEFSDTLYNSSFMNQASV